MRFLGDFAQKSFILCGLPRRGEKFISLLKGF